jgi:hypothetical protein
MDVPTGGRATESAPGSHTDFSIQADFGDSVPAERIGIESAEAGGSENARDATPTRMAEARLDALFLKSSLLRGLEPIVMPTPAQEPTGDGAEAAAGNTTAAQAGLAAEIFEYLAQHPEAADTLEGVNAWSSEYQDTPGLSARGPAVAMESLQLQAEGWERDDGTETDASGSPERTTADFETDDS